MRLVFADPQLRRAADSHTAWYQHVVPRLQTFWITPEIYGHAECSPALEPLLVRTQVGQQVPEPLAIARLFRPESGSVELAVEEFSRITGIGENDCLYLREAGLPYALAALLWCQSLPAGHQPRLIIHCEALRTPADPSVVTRIRELYNDRTRFVAAHQDTASTLAELLHQPVDHWPNPHSATPVPKYRDQPKPGRLVAVLGDLSPEKGVDILPGLALDILERVHDAAFLIHQSGGALDQRLVALEQANPRVVYLHKCLTRDAWYQILSAVDLAVLPYDRDVFRDRRSYLLEELIACGIPAVVPAGTALSQQIRDAGFTALTFEQSEPASIVRAVHDALSGYDTIARQAWNARQAAAPSVDPAALVSRILSWFPVERTTSSPAPAYISRTNEPKRILLSWAIDPAHMPPPRLSPHQVTAGPHPLATSKMLVRPNPGEPFAAYTPFFHTYDLKAVLEAQGIRGPFDLVVVYTESSFGNVPLNVNAFGCPTVCIAGDTHWGNAVLRRMVDYTAQNKFDFVVTTYNRQHMHWYREGGNANVAWIPALTASHIPQPLSMPKRPVLAFSGQRSSQHARRNRLLDRLESERLPLDVRAISRAESAALYHSAQLALNVSMNGDLNLRTFEVMSARGCLLADRLAPESGQSVLFEEGRDYLAFGSEEELIEMARRSLADPARAAAIAAHGHQTYCNNFLPEHQIRALTDWVFHDKLRAEYQSEWDARPQLASSSAVSLASRMSIYEQLQEAHRTEERLRVLVLPGVAPAIVADLVDLPRIECSVVEAGPDQPIRAGLEPFDLARRVTFLPHGRHVKQSGRWDYVLVPERSALLASEIPHGRTIKIGETGARPECAFSLHQFFAER